MVIFLSSSFLKRTVWTPEIALTIVDFPWATCPIVPGRDQHIIISHNRFSLTVSQANYSSQLINCKIERL